MAKIWFANDLLKAGRYMMAYIPGKTYKEIYLLAKQELIKAELESPAFDALCLFEKFFGMDRQKLAVHGDELPAPEKAEAFLEAIQKRASHTPLQYLLGSWPFYGMELLVGEGVLVPREETELLVDTAAELFRQQEEMLKASGREKLAVDLCSGTGAVALGLAKALEHDLPQGNIRALEWYPEAYGYLQKNLLANGPEIAPLKRDILRPETAEEFENIWVLVSNPPYIEAEEIKTLQAEVQQEPRTALDGGEDGLVFYRAIGELWIPRLVKGGVCAVEIGEEQGEAVAELFRQAGLTRVKILQDFNGLNRVVAGIRA